MKRVLEGIRVLDLGRFISAPYCSAILADMGAEVIRLERPGGEEDRRCSVLTPGGVAITYLILGRGKKGITLDLFSPAAKGLFHQLVAKSDILIHNQAPGLLEKLGYGFEQLKQINPGLVMAVVSGFGQYGPYAEKVCFDTVCQALSGAMSISGFPGNPPTRAAVPYVDYAAAAHACIGILLALRHRDRTGEGQLVDIAMFDAAVLQLHTNYAECEFLYKEREQMGNMVPYVIADLYRAKDGWLFLQVASNLVWSRMAHLMDRQDLAEDPRYGTDELRWDHKEELHPLLRDWVAARTVDQAMRELDAARIPAGAPNRVSEAMADPQFRAREIIMHLKHPDPEDVPVIGQIIKLSATPGVVERCAPEVGEHNDEVYRNLLHLSPEELAELRRKGVI